MPFKSKAQRRKFYAMANRGEMPKETVKHWEEATHGKKLPEHVKKAVEAAALKLPAMPTPITSTPLTPAVAVAAAPTIAKLKAQAIYKISEDVASQLKHHADPDSEFHPDQLAKGIEVEREHSENLPVRKAITKGHLAEFDRYYTGLGKMEEKLKAGKTAAYGLGVHAAVHTMTRRDS